MTGALLICAGLVGFSVDAGASTAPRRVLTPLERGLAFYRGKTITLIEPGATGALYDLIARSEAPYFGQYLHAQVNVEDVTIGNTIPAQDETAGANPDGLTLGMLNLGNDASLALTHTPGLNFNPARLEFVTANGSSTIMLIAATNSPYTAFDSLIKASPPATILMLNSGITNVDFVTLFGILGVHPHYVTGYSNLGGLVAGFQRGDGPVMFGSLSSPGPFVASGKARPLLISSVPPVGTLYRQYTIGVPTFASIEKEFPPKNKRQAEEWTALMAFLGASSTPVVTQTAVAQYKLDALRAAAVWTFHQAGFKSQMLAEGQNPTYKDPVSAKTNYLTLLKLGPLIEPLFAQYS